MKVMVRLAIVVAALLVVSNAAFAATCTGDYTYCYSVVMNKDCCGPQDPEFWMMCIDNDGTGTLCYESICVDLYEFGGGTSWWNNDGSPKFGGKPQWNGFLAIFDNETAEPFFLQTQGTNRYFLSGVGKDDEGKVVVNGTKVPLSNCVDD